MQFNPQSPKYLDKTLEGIIKYLGLDSAAAVHLKFSRPSTFTPELNHCHFNSWCQARDHGGSPQSGWVLAQDKFKGFAEAIFHTVWRAPDGKLMDVTPRVDLEKRLLFVPDGRRTITLTEVEGRPAITTFENVRVFQGELKTPLTPLTVVMQDDFAQRQKLWPW